MLSEHEGVLNQGLPWESRCRSYLDSPHGQKVRCGESQAHPAQNSRTGEEPTMRKGSYSEELVKHVV